MTIYTAEPGPTIADGYKSALTVISQLAAIGVEANITQGGVSLPRLTPDRIPTVVKLLAENGWRLNGGDTYVARHAASVRACDDGDWAHLRAIDSQCRDAGAVVREWTG